MQTVYAPPPIQLQVPSTKRLAALSLGLRRTANCPALPSEFAIATATVPKRVLKRQALLIPQLQSTTSTHPRYCGRWTVALPLFVANVPTPVLFTRQIWMCTLLSLVRMRSVSLLVQTRMSVPPILLAVLVFFILVKDFPSPTLQLLLLAATRLIAPPPHRGRSKSKLQFNKTKNSKHHNTSTITSTTQHTTNQLFPLGIN